MEDFGISPRDDFEQCLDYLSMYEEIPVPARSPRRPANGTLAKSGCGEINRKDSLDLMADNSSADYEVASDASTRNSLFSMGSDSHHKTPVDSAAYDQYVEEITPHDEICLVDNVVTILRFHDQWDPKKVAFVSMK